jgi:hypothetical protein
MTLTGTDALKSAAEAALHAPSILNTQPWRWRVTGDALQLSTDPDRQLPVIDPDHRLTTISCGIALHHARVALQAEGYAGDIERLPDPSRPELLARITVRGPRRPTTSELRDYDSILVRHTDRRLFADVPVPAEALNDLSQAAAAQGGHLYILRTDDTPVLAAAVSRAQEIEIEDPAYRDELAAWTNRDPASHDGVSPDTATPPAPRTVPVREFALDGGAQLPAGEGTDRQARFAVLAGDEDNPLSWLRAGEALSAAMLAAVHDGLSVSPMSDVTEVGGTREVVRGMLSGIGYPFLVLRVGVAEPSVGVPSTPRRTAADAIDVD